MALQRPLPPLLRSKKATPHTSGPQRGGGTCAPLFFIFPMLRLRGRVEAWVSGPFVPYYDPLVPKALRPICFWQWDPVHTAVVFDDIINTWPQGGGVVATSPRAKAKATLARQARLILWRLRVLNFFQGSRKCRQFDPPVPEELVQRQILHFGR